jgi:NADH-quinone oxidoreductase subunit G
MIAHRIRMATTQNNTNVLVVNPIDFPLHFKVAAKQIVPGGDLLQGLAKVAKALVDHHGVKADGELNKFLQSVKTDDEAIAQARIISEAKQGVLFLGALALNHPQAAAIRGMASFITAHSALTLGLLTPGANSAGAHLMNALPKQGLHAKAMLQDALKAVLLVGVEAEYDMANGHQALQSLSTIPCVIALHAYQTQEMLKYAQVILPITPFAEMAGTWVNAEGKWQTFSAAANPYGQSRPTWKVLRVLANLLGLEGFEYVDLEAVQAEINALTIDKTRHAQTFTFTTPAVSLPKGIVRIGLLPIYAQDALVRRADALQQTPDGLFTGVHMNRGQAIALGVSECLTVNVHQDTAVFQLPLILDETIPMHAVYLASGMRETMGLGASYQSIHIEQGSGYE